jgi:hypothetical protein
MQKARERKSAQNGFYEERVIVSLQRASGNQQVEATILYSE